MQSNKVCFTTLYKGADTCNKEQDLICSHGNGSAYGGESVSHTVTKLVQIILSYCGVQGRLSPGVCESEEGPNGDMESIPILGNKR